MFRSGGAAVMIPHIFPFTIAFADTDAAGIAYHARYIEIAERARMNWWKQMGMASGETGFAVSELSIKYKKPLRVGEDFIVETRATNIGAATVTVEQKFIKDSEICAIMSIKVAHMGKDLKPKRIPAEWLEHLAPVPKV